MDVQVIDDFLPITHLVTFRLLRSLHDRTLDGGL